MGKKKVVMAENDIVISLPPVVEQTKEELIQAISKNRSEVEEVKKMLASKNKAIRELEQKLYK